MNSLFQIEDKALFLPGACLYLDDRKKRSFGYISHAHGDHIARHDKIICTPSTAAILKLRLKNPNCWTLPFFEKTRINDSTITLFPAGHILGSAQIYFETAEGSLLYTGDFRTRPSRTAESFYYQHCNILIMETTFGRPHYRFQSRETVEEELLNNLKSKLDSGITPVVFVYPLGKGQEALHLLSHSGLPLAVDYSIIRYANIYQKFGVEFGPFEKFRRSDYKGRILLLPTMLRRNTFIADLKNKYTLFLSGWGIDDSARYRMGVDQVMTYSDHADYDELISFVEQVKPDKVYCTHGFDDFPVLLRQLGYDAELLFRPDQTALF